jgi:hypothetical protein
VATDRTRDLAHRLREALGEHTSTAAEQVLRDLWRDDFARNELFSRLQEREREPLMRLWENFGPGPRLTHHAGPGFQARVRWQDSATAMRRGAVRAALAREFGDAASGAPAGGGHALPLRAMPARRHAELVQQLEATALPLLEFARDAYRRGWSEEMQASDDIDRARAMLSPFAEAVEPLGPSLHARRRGAWLQLDGWGGTSACGILHGLASSLARELERGQLPRNRSHLVGEGLSQLLVPAWWDQLRRHLQHELDLLAGRATEEIEPGAPTRPANPRISAKIAHQILAAIASDTAGVLISWSAIAKAIGCRNESTVRRAGISLVNHRCIEQVDGRKTPYRLLPRGREILSR